MKEQIIEKGGLPKTIPPAVILGIVTALAVSGAAAKPNCPEGFRFSPSYGPNGSCVRILPSEQLIGPPGIKLLPPQQ